MLVIVSCPVAAPTVDGLNVNVIDKVWPGLSVAGRLIAETAKPVPVTATELTVTAAVPLEVRITFCVVGVLITTSPNEMLLAFRVSADVAAFSCREVDFAVLPVVAVSVTDCALVTEAAFAVNAAVVEVAATVTELGTVTAPLLLARPTATPPVGAEPDRVTVHESASDPVIDVLLQDTELIVGVTVVPVPLKLAEIAGALLEIVSWPVTEVAVVGLN